MAKFRYQHIVSSVEDKAPSASQIKKAEIAINDFKGKETLYIKNNNGEIVGFITEDAIKDLIELEESRAVSAETELGNIIIEFERNTVNALNELDEIKLDVSAFTDVIDDYYTKEETDERDLWVSGSGENCVVMKGGDNYTNGLYCIAEGYQTSATSYYAHAEGYKTKALAPYSHAEGGYGVASNQYAHAEGQNTLASGSHTHAEGCDTSAVTNYAHSEGMTAFAAGAASHAEGKNTKAIGESSHAEGYYTNAIGYCSHAEGNFTSAMTQYCHAEGKDAIASGYCSHAEGSTTEANGDYSHAEGQKTTASGDSSHAEGKQTKANGDYSHAEGYKTSATTRYSHAEGNGTTASGDSSHAEGYQTIANGNMSHVEGQSTTANGSVSHAEGFSTTAGGNMSHAEGSYSIASGMSSHAEGASTVASGQYSHAEGSYTTANNQSEHASGQYNVSSSASTDFGDSGNTLFSVGNGTASNARHNAFEIRQNGDIYITSGGTDILLQDALGSASITVDQEISSATSASTNAVSTSAVYDKIAEDEEVWALALNQLNDDKYGYVEYDDTDHSIYFYKDSNSSTPIGTIDVTEFASTITVEQDITPSNSASTNPIATKVVAEKELVTANALNDLNTRLNTLAIASSAVTSMDGYVIASTAAAIAVTDTLNQAIGKLEKMIADLDSRVTALGG